MTQTLKGTRWSLRYIKIIIVRVSESLSYRIWNSIGGRVRLIKCPFNGFKSVRPMEYSSYQELECILSKCLFTQFKKICSLEIGFKHVMVICKIGILNDQLVKGNFAIRKHYHFSIINFLLVETFNLLNIASFRLCTEPLTEKKCKLNVSPLRYTKYFFLSGQS